MDKLLNKIKLIISGYINRKKTENDDYLNGKIALAKEISDAIDFVNNKNLEIEKLDVGDIVFKETMESMPGSKGFNANYYLRLQCPTADMHLFNIPFIENQEDENNVHGDTFEVIVRKVENNKKNAARKNVDAVEPPKKVRRAARNIQWGYNFGGEFPGV